MSTRIKVNVGTIILVAAGGWILWKSRGFLGDLGGPSEEMMENVNKQVRPPIWDGWWKSTTEAWAEWWESTNESEAWGAGAWGNDAEADLAKILNETV